MVEIVEMDKRITLEKQLDEDVGPIVVMNKFNVDPQEVDEFLQVFAKTTETFKRQPGFISAQLHRGIAGSTNSLIMSFGNLQDTSNRHLIDQSLDRIWPLCCPIR